MRLFFYCEYLWVIGENLIEINKKTADREVISDLLFFYLHFFTVTFLVLLYADASPYALSAVTLTYIFFPPESFVRLYDVFVVVVTFVHFLPSVDLYTTYFEAPVTFFHEAVAVLLFDDLSVSVGAAVSVPVFNTELALPAIFFVESSAVTLNWYFVPALSDLTV